MAPKTRSQGVASPAPKLEVAPPRTRARKHNTINSRSTLFPVTSFPSSIQIETAAAISLVTEPSTVTLPIASSSVEKPSYPFATKMSYQQPLHSKSLRSVGLTHTRLRRSSNAVKQSVEDKSLSPELNGPPCCVHCHQHPFSLDDVPLVAPRIVHARINCIETTTPFSASTVNVKANCKNTSTQTSVDEQEVFVLTVQVAQTPLKRTREESAGEVRDGPAAKRHQSNPTQASTRTATSTITSIQSSAQTSTQSSTQTLAHSGSSSTTGKLFSSATPRTTPSRTTMASITQAKARNKSPWSSPVSRTKADSLRINRNMTWGQMTRVHSRRVKLAASREQQMQFSEEEELVDKESPQSSRSPDDQAPTTPQTAPQPRIGLFGSIRKALDFVPQLPASVTKSIFNNPFAQTRQIPAPKSQQHDAPSSQQRANSMNAHSFVNSPEEEVSEVRPPAQRRDALGPQDRASSSDRNSRAVGADAGVAKAGPDAVTTDANVGHTDVDIQLSSQKRKRHGYGMYFDDSTYDSEASLDSDSLDGESSAPEAKKQKLDEAQTPRSVLKRRMGNGAGTVHRINKHVTFDDSPLDTPSKLRARSFEYTGSTFADLPNHSSTSPSSDDETSLSNSPGTRANTEANTSFHYERPWYPPLPEGYVLPPDFTPTSANPRPGTFCLDFNTYDENDDEIDWDAPAEAIHGTVVENPKASTSFQTSTSKIGDRDTMPATESPPATPRITHAELPSTTIAPAGINIHSDVDASTLSPPKTAGTNVLADVTQEQINKVRSTAEQHKSKNPSRLSQVERATSASPAAEEKPNEFDAGWPKPKSYVEAGVCSQRIFDIVSKGWDPRDSIIGEMVYQQDLKEWTDAYRLEKEQGVPVTVHWGDTDEELQA